MTLFFDGELLERSLPPELAVRAMEICFDAEADGTTRLPLRIDTPTGRGFIRVMPAVLDDVMGLKVMTLVEGSGTRYLVLLYDVASGALVAMFDADELTRVRTAAVTTLAGNAMLPTPPHELALIGTGFEAVGHVRMMARVWPLRRVFVYSPNSERRARFARTLSDELGIEIVAAASEADALRGRSLVVLATKSKTPVIDGDHLSAGCVVLSIGSTRLDLRELDDRSLARASMVVADDPDAVAHESADIAETIAAGLLDRDSIVALSALRRGGRPLRARSGDVTIFKSVGTALQDLALARMLWREDAMRAAATTLPELSRLKPFATKPQAATAAVSA